MNRQHAQGVLSVFDLGICNPSIVPMWKCLFLLRKPAPYTPITYPSFANLWLLLRLLIYELSMLSLYLAKSATTNLEISNDRPEKSK
jgi:hypothetical protein